MEPTDLTHRLLREIRDSIRAQSDRFDKRMASLEKKADTHDKRFEVIETSLRDLAQQMVLLSRGIKTALDRRGRLESTLDDHEKRLADLEKRQGH